MTWTIVTGPTFPKDLESLPAKVRKQIAAFISEVLGTVENPYAIGKLEKLKGSQGFYRFRFGSYRLGLILDDENKTIHLLRIMHRRDIYRHFP